MFVFLKIHTSKVYKSVFISLDSFISNFYFSDRISNTNVRLKIHKRFTTDSKRLIINCLILLVEKLYYLNKISAKFLFNIKEMSKHLKLSAKISIGLNKTFMFGYNQVYLIEYVITVIPMLLSAVTCYNLKIRIHFFFRFK